MTTGIGARVRLWMAAAGALALAGCTTSDWEGVAMGLNMVADDMAVTMTMVPAWECGVNAQGYAVCDDTGDGYADRYGDPAYEFVHGWNYGVATRVNDYGEAFQYDGGCDCWRRQPSLDTYPK
jgi:hypothetical protein